MVLAAALSPYSPPLWNGQGLTHCWAGQGSDFSLTPLQQPHGDDHKEMTREQCLAKAVRLGRCGRSCPLACRSPGYCHTGPARVTVMDYFGLVDKLLQLLLLNFEEGCLTACVLPAGAQLWCGSCRDMAPRAGCTQLSDRYIKAPQSAQPGMGAEFGSWTGSARPSETGHLMHRKGLCFGKAPVLLCSGSGLPCGALLVSMFSQALTLHHFCGMFV